MNECPVCNSQDYIQLNINTTAKEYSYKPKDDYAWNINIYFCLDCNNIYGEKTN